MKNKRFFRSFFVLLAVLVCLGGFSVTAYAGGGEEIPTDDSNVKTEAEPQPLTPEGNMTLIDDIEGDAAGDKQFIVVQSRGGNYFYIVIDKAAQGENTVHFLNQVDEADLLSIIEDGNGAQETPAVCSCTDKCTAGSVNIACPVCSTDMSKCAGKEAQTDPDELTGQPEEKSGMGGLAIFLVIALLGGGGALYYFKVMKPKQNTKGSTDLEDFDFDEYDDYDEDEPEAEADAAAEDEEQEDDE